MRISTTLSAVAFTAATLVSQVNAHGWLVDPHYQCSTGGDPTKFIAEIRESTAGLGGGKITSWPPTVTAKNFKNAFDKAGYSSLKDFLDKKSGKAPCSGSNTSKRVNVAGKTTATWQNEFLEKPKVLGFLDSHAGPCEAWIDDKMLWHKDDCVAAFGAYAPAVMPVDFSQCKGDCMFRFVWVALHQDPWQYYDNCIAISNGSGGGSPPAAPPAAPSTAPPTAPATAPPTESPTAPPTEPPAVPPTEPPTAPPSTPSTAPPSAPPVAPPATPYCKSSKKSPARK